MTAWHALVEVGRLQAGETLLIHAAGSGVSSAGIQLAKHLGATVLATAGTEEKLEWATQLGADHVLNNRTGDVTAFAREATAGAGVTWSSTTSALRCGRPRCSPRAFTGASCSAATSPQRVTVNLATPITTPSRSSVAAPTAHDEFAKMLETAWSAGFRSIVDSSFPLSDAGAAQEKVSAAEFMGRCCSSLDHLPQVGRAGRRLGREARARRDLADHRRPFAVLGLGRGDRVASVR